MSQRFGKMVTHRFVALALLSSVLFHATAKDVLDDMTFDVVTRELEGDLDSGDLSDMDSAAVRRLNVSDTTTTTAAPETVTGTLTFGGMTDAQADAFMTSAPVLTAIKAALANKLSSGVTASAVAVTLTKNSGRRLQEVEPRALQGTVSVDAAYTITLPSGVTAASATSTLGAVTPAEFKTAFLGALTDADLVTLYTNIITITSVVGPTTTTTTAPVVDTESGAAKMALTSSLFALAAAWLGSMQA